MDIQTSCLICLRKSGKHAWCSHGPNACRRRLYAAFVHTVLMYAVSVWKNVFSTGKRNWLPLEQRKDALRVVSAYRTVSHAISRLLARIMPIEILVDTYTWRYWEKKKLRCRILDQGANKIGEEFNTLSMRAILRGLEKWCEKIANDESNVSVLLRGIFSEPDVLKKWYFRKHGNVAFHTTQMLSGHGAFATLRERIGKANSGRCEECEEVVDDTLNTLARCARWVEERESVSERNCRIIYAFGY